MPAPPSLDLLLVRSFLAVIEAQGFTRAAAALGCSQSTVSLHLRRLEEALGQRLLQRHGGRGIRLTPAGETLVSYARTLLQVNDELLARLSGREALGEVRIGVPEDFVLRWLPAVLREFEAQNPQARLATHCALSNDLREAGRREELDIIVARRPPGLPDGGTALWRERLSWVTAKGQFPERQRPLPLVLHPWRSVFRSQALEGLDLAGIAWRAAFTSTSIGGMRSAVAAGFGVALLSEGNLDGELRVIGPEAGLPAIEDSEVALYVVGRRPSPTAQLLAAMIRERAVAAQQKA